MALKNKSSIYGIFFVLTPIALISILTAPYFISAAGEYADATLIRAKDDDKVYYLEDGKKRWVDSLESFKAHNFEWDEVIIVSQLDLGAYELGQALDRESSIKKRTVQDTAEPVISKITAANITATTAVITWLTNELSDSKINYALASSLEMVSTAADSNKVVNHSLTLSNLTANTIYYYTVVSADKNNNTAASAKRSFTTLPLSSSEFQNWQKTKLADVSDGVNVPSMVWTGSEYGAVWSNAREGKKLEIYFALLNGNGIKIGKDINISNNPARVSSQPAIVWTGEEYGIIWSEYSENSDENSKGCYLYFARLDVDGVGQGKNMLAVSDNYGSCPSEPAIVWTGSEYGISWHESRLGNTTSRIFFARLNQSGEKQGEDVQISDNSISEDSSIAWSGKEFGLVWKEGSPDSKIYFARLNAGGTKQGQEVKVNNTAGASLSPSIAWTGSDYSIFWQGQDSENERQIYFTKLDQNGYKRGDDIVITSNSVGDYSIYPSFAWTGQEYGVAFQQGEKAIYFVRFDAKGNKKSAELQISDVSKGQTKHPVIAWNGVENKYGIIWSASRDGGGEIYFATPAASLTDLSALKGENYLASIWANRPIIIIFFLAVLSLGILGFGVWHFIKNRPQGGTGL